MIITVIATGFNKYSQENVKAIDIIENLRNGNTMDSAAMQQPKQQKQDYMADLDIPPFLRKNRD